MQSPDGPRLGATRVEASLCPFERVSLNLAALCGAIPLDNYLANDYDDSVELDYREFEREDFGGSGNPDVNRDSSSDTSEDEEDSGDELAPMDVDSEAAAGSGRDLGARSVADCRLIGDESSLAALASSSGPLFRDSDCCLTTTASPTERDAALEKLHKACKRLSGTSEALHFEFIEEDPSCAYPESCP